MFAVGWLYDPPTFIFACILDKSGKDSVARTSLFKTFLEQRYETGH